MDTISVRHLFAMVFACCYYFFIWILRPVTVWHRRRCQRRRCRQRQWHMAFPQNDASWFETQTETVNSALCLFFVPVRLGYLVQTHTKVFYYYTWRHLMTLTIFKMCQCSVWVFSISLFNSIWFSGSIFWRSMHYRLYRHCQSPKIFMMTFAIQFHEQILIRTKLHQLALRHCHPSMAEILL